MAIIPRMNQGDRPSAVSSPTLDNSLANIAGAVGDMSNAALETATAEELAQRKAYAAALEEKQKIVDASNAGRVSLEFEDTHFQTLADLETNYAETPEVIPQKYTEAMRTQAEKIKSREDLNDTVKLTATRSAESTMSSGLRAAYDLSSRLQTGKIREDIRARAQGVVNRAASLTSAASVEAYAAKELEILHPFIVATRGKNSKADEEQIKGDIVKRYVAERARKDPLGADFELRNSPFIQNNLSGAEHASLVAAADSAYYKLNDTRNLEIAKSAFAAGEILAASLGTDEFIPAATSRMKALVEEKKNLGVNLNSDGVRLRPEDAKKQAEKVGVQIKRLQTLMDMNYKQLDTKALDDVDTVNTLLIAHDELFTKIGKSSVEENLEGILTFQDALEKARGEKKITKAKYDAMKGSITNAYSGVTTDQEGQYSWLSWYSNERAGVAELNKQFKGAYSSQPPEVQNSVRVEYMRAMQKAQKEGGMDAAKAVRLAQQILSRETGDIIEAAFK